MAVLKEEIIKALQEVYDPEIPINVYDLGLIYDITVTGDKARVLMTFTSPSCPTTEYLKSMVQEAVENVEEINSCEITVTFEPAWNPERISPEAREELGFLDIPKEKEDLAVKGVYLENDPSKMYTKEKLCFNCGVSDKERPLFQTFYKDEQTYLCTKCIGKF
ncbi:DUF59 domain-containing protein [Candidatus Woesearchaeota archaeon]|nr:DUF59 domain-containing protein [Nanoarchaeota archaeon]MCB9370393.1 DUF59 domain-containing protein [Candidatus Woesearchaeota archaeon]USN44911.1 MAG: DUF59 domain-containing protein [Candidatus Woesearchaeota archaeon]